MAAGSYQIVDIEQGADWNLYLIFQEANGTATNLTGCSLKMKIKTDYTANNGTLVANLTTPSGGISITSLVGGLATATMNAAFTSNLTAGNYLYDLKLVSPTGLIDREFQGGAVVLPGVTD